MFRRRNKMPLPSRVREAVYPRRGWGRAIEYVGHRVRRIPDTPHRIALGVACGVMVCFTPFFGLHFLLAAGLAWLVGANLLASLIGTFFGNPLTFPVIASVSLGLGRRILGWGVTGRDFGRVVDAFAEAFAWAGRGLLAPFGEGAWVRVGGIFSDLILPYFVGGLLPGLVTATACYYLLRPLIGAYQNRRRARRLARTGGSGDREGRG